MRNITTRPLPILTILLPFTTAVTLSEIQQINGFSPACENAYNTPLSGCTATDFSSGVCSGTCIAFLNALTQIINAECTGTSAYPNTLMGSFFQNQGTGVLCPNALGGSDQGLSSGGSYSLTSTVATSTSPSAETTVPSTTVPTTTSIAMTTTFTPSSTVQITSILSASGAATTTSDIVAITTVTPNAPLSMSTIKTSDVKQSSTSTLSASTSASSSSSNGGGGNGGGTILDVGSNSSCRNAEIKEWILLLLAGSAGLALLL